MSLPRRIKISGLPLMLCGWNTELVLDEEANCYNLRPYVLWYIFGIFGGKIVNRPGVGWVFLRQGFELTDFRQVSGNAESPVGEWTYGATVTAV